MEIGIVSEFNYLGVLLSKSGNFSMAKKAQVEKAKTYNIQKRHQAVFEDPLWFPTLSLYRRRTV